ncbi:MAG: hypothetical protein QOD82_7274, partial [Pseudonocardiales bacterium]|nr:hypothetical protein [Pseudonocardiales bacterium]
MSGGEQVGPVSGGEQVRQAGRG